MFNSRDGTTSLDLIAANTFSQIARYDSGGVATNSLNIYDTYTSTAFEVRGPSTSSTSNSLSFTTKDYVDDFYNPRTTTVSGGLKLQEASNNGNGVVILKAPDAVATTYNIVYPDAIGNVGDVLTCVSKSGNTMIMGWQAP